MSASVFGLLIGGWLIYLGFTNQFEAFARYIIKQPDGYLKINLPRYILAALIITTPAYLAEKRKPEYASSYVFLIILTMVVYYWRQIGKTQSDIGLTNVITE